MAQSASPAIAALLVALWPLGLVLGMIGAFMLGRRIRRVEEWVESPSRTSALLAALLFVLAFFHSWYLQRSLNRAWERAERGR